MKYNPYKEESETYPDRNTTNFNYLRGTVKAGVKRMKQEGATEKEIEVTIRKAMEEALELAEI